MYFPFLPKLKNNSSITPDKASVWENKSTNFLTSLIESLEVSGSIEEIGEIDSIPDMWARPILFEMALFDNQDAKERQFISGLHERILGEWRGLLAMLALMEIKHLDIKAEEVNIDINQRDTLTNTLAKLLPESQISKDTDWKRLYVISYKGIPIAMTSPTTLVCTAADYRHIKILEPWSTTGKYLEDPIKHLTDEDLRMLASWLRRLASDLRKHSNIATPHTMQYLVLLDRLDQYIRDVENQLNESNITYEHIFNKAKLNLNAGIFRYLDSSVMAKEASVSDSHVRLVESEGRNPQKALLLFAKDIADKWHVPANKLLLWPGLPAATIEFGVRGNSRDHVSGAHLKGAEYRFPDEFFYDKLGVIRVTEPLPGAEYIMGTDKIKKGNDQLTPLLPIKRELLDYISSKDIVSRISFEDTQDNIIMRFRFPLSGCNNAQTDYVYEKMYSKDDLIPVPQVPVLEIWPNFKANWQQYYIYYKNHQAGSSRQDLAKNTFFAEPWAFDAKTKENIPGKGQKNRYIGCLDKFPEILFCSVNYPIDGQPSGQLLDVGMIILKQPEIVANYGGGTWDIGIDFGTSGTMVYRKVEGQRPEPLVFTPNLFQVTKSGNDRTNLYLDFMTAEPEKEDSKTKGSFLSIFDLHNTEQDIKALRPLIDGHIYFLKDFMDFNSKGKKIESDLKWNAPIEGRYKAAAYLEQVCIQCAAEAISNGATKINWNFSYPTAFSIDDYETFSTRCQKASEKACEISGLAITNNVVTETESVATALCFNNFNGSLGNFSRGAICIDIGSGTSDISIICGRPAKIVYHTSIRFAGRQLFSPLNKENNRNAIILSAMKDMTTSRAVSEEFWGELLKKEIHIVMDSILRAHGDEMLSQLDMKATEKHIKEILQPMIIGVSGLLYYAGLIVAQLHETGVYQGDVMPNIYIGGNGSRVFNWIAGGKYDSDNSKIKLLKKIVQQAAGLKADNFNIVLSPIPKSEVAYGLVNDKPVEKLYDQEKALEKLFPDNIDEYKTNPPVLAGEYCYVGDIKKNPGSFMNANDIANGIDIRSLKQFEQFIDLFNKFPSESWTGKIQMKDGKLLSEIQQQTTAYYDDEIGKKAEEIRVNPIFITALNIFMDRY